MLAVLEIKEAWDTIQQNKQAFWQQVERWIADAKSSIYKFAKDYEHCLFTDEYAEPISRGIIGKALKDGLDATDVDQRKQAAGNLLEQISWSGTTDFMSKLAKERTIQLCDEMHVTKELISSLFLAAGGYGSIGMGGGGSSNNEINNWDGTKKKTGWGIS